MRVDIFPININQKISTNEFKGIQNESRIGADNNWRTSHKYLQSSKFSICLRRPFLQGKFSSVFPSIFSIIETLMMFLGELLCLPIFYFLKWKFSSQYQQKQAEAVKEGKRLAFNRLKIIVPAICDLVNSSMHFIALNYISSSTYQMFEGGSIITTFLFSLILLHQPFLRHQFFGTILAFFGILVVGFANIINQSQENDSTLSLEMLGYFLMIGALCFGGLQYTTQQKIINNYYIQPLQMVGFEGLFGFCIYTVLVTVLCFVPCHWRINACVYTPEGFGYMESTTAFFSQIRDNLWLLLLSFCWIFAVTAYNPLGVSIIKHINAVARPISNVSQTILVWLIGIIVTLTSGATYPNFYWEKLDALVIILQFVGFIFIVIGNLSYNQVLKLPFLAVKQKDQNASNTEDLLAKQQNGQGKKDYNI